MPRRVGRPLASVIASVFALVGVSAGAPVAVAQDNRRPPPEVVRRAYEQRFPVGPHVQLAVATGGAVRLLTGTLVPGMSDDSLRLRVIPAGPDGLATGPATEEVAAAWADVRIVRVAEPDRGAVRRRVRGAAVRGALVGAGVGALVAGQDRAVGAAIGGVTFAWFGGVLSAMNAEVYAPRQWRNLWSSGRQ